MSPNGKENVTVREAYNLFAFLSDIGGFFGIIVGFGSYFNLIFSSTINKSIIAKRLFRIQNG